MNRKFGLLRIALGDASYNRIVIGVLNFYVAVGCNGFARNVTMIISCHDFVGIMDLIREPVDGVIENLEIPWIPLTFLMVI